VQDQLDRVFTQIDEGKSRRRTMRAVDASASDQR
jgi:hypothetical protein